MQSNLIYLIMWYVAIVTVEPAAAIQKTNKNLFSFSSYLVKRQGAFLMICNISDAK